MFKNHRNLFKSESRMKQDALPEAGVIAHSSAGDSVLSLLSVILREFHRKNISYCYWKGSRRIHRGLTGEGDLDLLVLKEDQHRAQAILLKQGLKLFPCLAYRDHPALLSFLGYDESNGQIVHVHLHFRLVAGNSLLYLAALPVFRVLQTRLARTELTEEWHHDISRQHAEIVAAIERGEGDEAAALMHDHLAFIRPSYEAVWRHALQPDA